MVTTQLLSESFPQRTLLLSSVFAVRWNSLQCAASHSFHNSISLSRQSKPLFTLSSHLSFPLPYQFVRCPPSHTDPKQLNLIRAETGKNKKVKPPKFYFSFPHPYFSHIFHFHSNIAPPYSFHAFTPPQIR